MQLKEFSSRYVRFCVQFSVPFHPNQLFTHLHKMPFQRSAKHKKYYSFNASRESASASGEIRVSSFLQLSQRMLIISFSSQPKRLLRGEMCRILIWTGEKWKQFLCWTRRENKKIWKQRKQILKNCVFFPLLHERFFLVASHIVFTCFLLYLRRSWEGYLRVFGNEFMTRCTTI